MLRLETAALPDGVRFMVTGQRDEVTLVVDPVQTPWDRDVYMAASSALQRFDPPTPGRRLYAVS